MAATKDEIDLWYSLNGGRTFNMLEYDPDAIARRDELYRNIERYESETDPQFSNRVAQIGDLYPTMSAEMAFSIADNPDIDIRGEDVMNLAEQEGFYLIDKTDPSRLQSTKQALINAPVRTAFSLFDYIGQEVLVQPLRTLAISQDMAAQEMDETGFWGNVGRTAQGIAGLTPLYEAPWERKWDEAKQFEGKSSLGAAIEARGGDVFNALGGIMAGDEDIAGKGFFQRGESLVGTDRDTGYKIAGGYADTGGLLTTALGRGIKNTVGSDVLSTDSRSYEVFSALTQMTFEILGDPMNGVAGSVGKINKARRGLGRSQNIGFGASVRAVAKPDAPTVRDYMNLNKAGFSFAWRNNSNQLDAQLVDNFLRSEDFEPSVRLIASMGDDVYGRMGPEDFNKMGQQLSEGKVPKELRDFAVRVNREMPTPMKPAQLFEMAKGAARAQATGDRSHIIDSVSRLVDAGHLGARGEFAIGRTSRIPFLKKPINSPWLKFLPEDRLDLTYDSAATGVIDQFTRMGEIIGMKSDEISDALEPMFRLDGSKQFIGEAGFLDRSAVQSVLETKRNFYTVARNKLVAKGMDRDQANVLTQMAKGEREMIEDILSSNIAPEFLQDQGVELARLVDAVHISDTDTLMDSKISKKLRAIGEVLDDEKIYDAFGRKPNELASSVPLPNIPEIVFELSDWKVLESVKFKTAFEKFTVIQDKINRVVVPMQLLRLAWTLRVTTEETIRMAATGYDTLLTSPANALMWMSKKSNLGKTVDEIVENVDKTVAAAMNPTDGTWDNHLLPPGSQPTRGISIHEQGTRELPETRGVGYELGVADFIADAQRSPHTRALAARLARINAPTAGDLTDKTAELSMRAQDAGRSQALKIEEAQNKLRDIDGRINAAEDAEEIGSRDASMELPNLRRERLRMKVELEGMDSPDDVTRKVFNEVQAPAEGTLADTLEGMDQFVEDWMRTEDFDNWLDTLPKDQANAMRKMRGLNIVDAAKTNDPANPALQFSGDTIVAGIAKEYLHRVQEILKAADDGTGRLYEIIATGKIHDGSRIIDLGSPIKGNKIKDESLDRVLIGGEELDDSVLQWMENAEEGSSNWLRGEKTLAPREELVNWLRREENFNLGPNKVTARSTDILKPEEALQQRWRNFTAKAFEYLMARPSNYLSRNPMFKQAYWQRMADLSGSLTPAEAKKLLKLADEAFPKASHKRHRHYKAIKANIKESSGELSVDDVNRVAKAFALGEVNDLLYKAANRGAWSTMYRSLFLYADAWQEIYSTWGKVIFADRQGRTAALGGMINTGGQALQPAQRIRQVVGAAERNGVFYDDEGTSRFMYPFTAAGLLRPIIEKFYDTDLSDTGQSGTAAGLNLFSQSVVPSLGLMTSIAVSALPDKGFITDFKNSLLPFGDVDISKPGELITDQVLPTWFKKGYTTLMQDEFDNRDKAVAMMNAMVVLYHENPKKYQDTDKSERGAMRQLLNDSRDMATATLLVNAIDTAFMPTNPSAEFFITTDENVFNLSVLSREWQRIKQSYDGDEELATRQFVKEFLMDPMLLKQGKSRSNRFTHTSEAAMEWRRKNEGLVEKFPAVVGYFAPIDYDGQQDWDAYRKAIARGDIENLNPEQWIELVNSRAGQIRYENVKIHVENMDLDQEDENIMLRMARERLKAQYPGYGMNDPTIGKGEEARFQMEQIVQDPAIRKTELGRSVSAYLILREDALRSVRERTGKADATLEGKAAAPERARLRQHAEYLQNKYQGFGQIWVGLYASEAKE